MAIDRDKFIEILSERFPAVVAEIDDCSTGLLHLEMATFARATSVAISAGDTRTIRSHFDFADQLLRDGNADVQNAVAVSYLEVLDLDGPHAADAREMLSPELATELCSIEGFWNPESVN